MSSGGGWPTITGWQGARGKRLSLKPNDLIHLHPHTFHRVPFNRLPPWHTRGTARRVIGYEPGRELWEVELDGREWVVWDFEIEGREKRPTGVSLSRGGGG